MALNAWGLPLPAGHPPLKMMRRPVGVKEGETLSLPSAGETQRWGAKPADPPAFGQPKPQRNTSGTPQKGTKPATDPQQQRKPGRGRADPVASFEEPTLFNMIRIQSKKPQSMSSFESGQMNLTSLPDDRDEREKSAHGPDDHHLTE
jgi:hypothetical protein